MFRAAWNYRGLFPECEVAALCRPLGSECIHDESMETCEKHCRNAESDSYTGRPGGKLPYEHWTRLRTNNALERIMKEIRRRTRIIGAFPDGYSAMMLVGARLRHISTTKWGTRQYLNTCKRYKTV